MTYPAVGGRRPRGYLVLVVLGIVAFVIGALLLAASTVPQTRNTTFYLQPGQYYYTRVQFDVVTGGTVTVDFEASPGAVDQYVMTAAEYTSFLNGVSLSYLAATSGSIGTFSASLPSGGTYYVVTAHGSGYESTAQSGRHTITIAAVATSPFVAGVVAFVVGGVLLGIGAWLRTRPAKPPPFVPYAPTSPYPYGRGPVAGGPPMGPTPMPQAGWAAYPAAIFPTLLVRVENVSTTDETVQIRVNGVPTVTLPVGAGKTAEASVHPNVVIPPGTAVRLEAVTAAGVRATQDVTVDASGSATASLRIG